MARRQCSFCGSSEVILTSGYSYCKRCIGARERRTIDIWASEILKNGNLKANLTELFKTPDYCFPSFNNLYDRWPRGGLTKSGDFIIPQKTYLLDCLKNFISQRGEK